MDNILITGGAGFIGSNLAETLIQKGKKVIVLDNFDPFYPEKFKESNIKNLLAEKKFHFIRGDIRDLKDLDHAFSFHPDIVVHLAARAGVRQSLEKAPEYASINIEGTLQLLDACRRHHVKKMVFSSSSSVYGNNTPSPFKEEYTSTCIPEAPYGVTKLAGEIFCKNYHKLFGMDIFCLRFFSVYGPRQRPDMAIYKFAKSILQEELITLYGDGSSLRDYTYVGDIVDGITCAMERVKGFEILNLVLSTPISLLNLVQSLEKILGKKAILKHIPMQQGEMDSTYADGTKVSKILDYSPKTQMKDGLLHFVKWLRQNIKTK